ncbi:MAG: hypothetical protein ACYSTI_06725 [Planctomycetota bacterium]|jgi:hypothetical protein
MVTLKPKELEEISRRLNTVAQVISNIMGAVAYKKIPTEGVKTQTWKDIPRSELNKMFALEESLERELGGALDELDRATLDNGLPRFRFSWDDREIVCPEDVEQYLHWYLGPRGDILVNRWLHEAFSKLQEQGNKYLSRLTHMVDKKEFARKKMRTVPVEIKGKSIDLTETEAGVPTFEIIRSTTAKGNKKVKGGILRSGQKEFTLTAKPALALKGWIRAYNDRIKEPARIKGYIVAECPDWGKMRNQGIEPDLKHAKRQVKEAFARVLSVGVTPWHPLPFKIDLQG